MNIQRPKGFETQPFAANANPSYKSDGLKGHTGIDYVLGHKATIEAAVTGEVYSILNQYNPDYNKYRAVFQIVDDKDFSYEVSYGHVDSVLVKEDSIVPAGDPIATEGNYGTSYSGGKFVTPDEKVTGKGSHLHFQVRKCKRVPKRAKGKTYLRNSEGYLVRMGMYYEVVDFNNGYNGCVDPKLLYVELFNQDLSFGDKGPDVEKLQKFLKEYGTFTYDRFTGNYGEETRKAVYEFQVREKVSNLVTLAFFKGKYCHAATRKRINQILTK